MRHKQPPEKHEKFSQKEEKITYVFLSKKEGKKEWPRENLLLLVQYN